MSQGAVKKRWGVKFYALVVSISVHVIVLSIFAAVKFSQSAPIPLKTTTVVTISQAAVLADRSSIAPKPKISPAGEVRRIVKTAGQGPSANMRPVFEPTKQGSQLSTLAAENPDVDSGDSAKNSTTITQNFDKTSRTVEFFDSPAQGRRICYVVDCSGSMQGLWGQVKAELLESIGQLQPDQYFSVIVFGSGSIMESGGGWLVRANARAKKDAYNFIDSVQPRGTTNASAALEHAIKIRDRSGIAPSLIYFLTDGFELNEHDNFRFAHQVETMLKSFAPKTQINTIGFWPDEQDRKLLELIARESGGQFVMVGDSSQRKNGDN